MNFHALIICSVMYDQTLSWNVYCSLAICIFCSANYIKLLWFTIPVILVAFTVFITCIQCRKVALATYEIEILSPPPPPSSWDDLSRFKLGIDNTLRIKRLYILMDDVEKRPKLRHKNLKCLEFSDLYLCRHPPNSV